MSCLKIKVQNFLKSRVKRNLKKDKKIIKPAQEYQYLNNRSPKTKKLKKKKKTLN